MHWTVQIKTSVFLEKFLLNSTGQRLSSYLGVDDYLKQSTKSTNHEKSHKLDYIKTETFDYEKTPARKSEISLLCKRSYLLTYAKLIPKVLKKFLQVGKSKATQQGKKNGNRPSQKNLSTSLIIREIKFKPQWNTKTHPSKWLNFKRKTMSNSGICKIE